MKSSRRTKSIAPKGKQLELRAEPPPQKKKLTEIDDELSQLWRAIAFIPARTVEGVVAKLDAVSALR